MSPGSMVPSLRAGLNTTSAFQLQVIVYAHIIVQVALATELCLVGCFTQGRKAQGESFKGVRPRYVHDVSSRLSETNRSYTARAI